MDPRDEWEPWEKLITNRGLWRSILKRATTHCLLQTQKRVEWYSWHRQVLLLLRDHQLWTDVKTVANDTMHGCLRCGLRFATKAAWSVHCFKLHGRLTRVRSVASGETCVICHKIYATHDRLINHLRYSQRCFREMRRRHLYTNPQPGRNSVTELQQRHTVQRPTMMTEGPMVEETEGPDGRHLDDCEIDLQGALIALFHEFEEHRREEATLCSTEDLTRRVWQVFQQGTSYPAEMKLMLSYAISRYQQTLEQEDEVDRDIHGGLESLYDRVNQLWCKDWIMGHLPTERATRKTGHGDLDPDREFQQLQRQRVSPVIPRPLRTRAHIFLHLFSGHRREGDVQACVETYSYTLGGAVRALSVDLVISASWGDLSDPSTQRLFMQAIMEGWISGLASGPRVRRGAKRGRSDWTTRIGGHAQSVMPKNCGAWST